MLKLVSVTEIGQASVEPGEKVSIGIDLGRSKWVFALSWGGEVRRRLATPGELCHLEALLEHYRSCRVQVAYEACGFGYEIAWYLQGRAIPVTVVAPVTIERARGARVKNDKIDAAELARKLEKGDLKGIYIPNRREHEDRQLSRTYVKALKARQRAQVQIRALLQEQGRIGPSPTTGWVPYAAWLRSQNDLPEAVKTSVEELTRLREVAAESAKRLKAAVLDLAKRPEYAVVASALRHQPGVGPFTAIRLVVELGTIERFPTAGSFAHYLGLTPSEYSSSDTTRRGHILKCGPGYIRSWLLECAWKAIRIEGGEEKLRECFEKLAPRIGRKRAIVAVTRRLALRLRARWIEAIRAPVETTAA
ncbi:MAG: IS110 family transposase [Methyloceanibacter sp.]